MPDTIELLILNCIHSSPALTLKTFVSSFLNIGSLGCLQGPNSGYCELLLTVRTNAGEGGGAAGQGWREGAR